MTENTQTRPRTWLITGATSGIGRELATQALDAGENVAALARSTAALEELRTAHPDRLLLIDTDVRDQAAVTAAVAQAVDRFGGLDVVSNNAGYGLFGAVEEATDEQARAIFDTNVFGVLNVLRAALPVLRAQGSGHVFQGSSLYGQSAHSGVGLLAATKYAVEGLSDALADELAPLGIKVTMVQPGPTATAFLGNLDIAAAIPDYDRTVREVQKAIGAQPVTAFASPARIAAGIRAAAASDTPPLRLALGISGADAMRTALTARLADLDAWAETTRAVDA
ncbi:SDR family NAD(P)-dependent oxidoreductase [Actinacidiphila glaucinigra]|uniref:Short-chain dehydrogenase n=1 Tax=Actinacidiphila glaucinigra TaxID=235986 RepID=A0A239IC77_9ACTN|nr:SDR family NAD(P)-dependent oxidoreductase [Actinacidiphila glaucinigra]SNS91250.1 Short-chain dehydrogenase [Actinacidiphila glaucinigra]